MTPHTPAASAAPHDGPSDQPTPTGDADTHLSHNDRGDAVAAATATTTNGHSGAGIRRRTAASHGGGPLTRGALDDDLAAAVRRTTRMRQAFYLLVLLVALVGQATGAVQSLDVPMLVAVPAVAALELGGVVVMANADVRRRLGERATASRLLSATIAAAAVAFNWVAHPDHLVGGFYAGMSALGYLVWLMHAGNQRRDRLRATGNLPPTPPAYEVLAHWIRHPLLTTRARAIAKAGGLDLYESLDAARTVTARRRRDAAIATVLHRRIRAAVDPSIADIAVRVYDLDEIAARLAATADYHGLTTLLAADLAPERIVTAQRAPRLRRWHRRNNLTEATRAPEPIRSSAPIQPEADTQRDGRQKPEPPTRHAGPAPNDDPQQPAHTLDSILAHTVPPSDGPRPTTSNPAVANTPSDDNTDNNQTAGSEADDGGHPQVPKTTAEAVAYWLRREPNLDPELLAQKIGKSLRSVYRYLPPDYPRRPGIARQRTRR
ncbi:hypothetical protein [Micromonospora sp. NPDC047134]|uniref:hypothetical protein n=1 Tax=Micromonospora sp. NPDC047134 TaxID=3154340 RepID=UPI0033F30413